MRRAAAIYLLVGEKQIPGLGEAKAKEFAREEVVREAPRLKSPSLAISNT